MDALSKFTVTSAKIGRAILKIYGSTQMARYNLLASVYLRSMFLMDDHIFYKGSFIKKKKFRTNANIALVYVMRRAMTFQFAKYCQN